VIARSPLRIAVPDVPAARALAHQWEGGTGAVGTVKLVPLEEADAHLRAGRVDLAFVPTLTVLRSPDDYSVVPGVALSGRAYPAARLHLPTGLAPLAPGNTARLGLDPRFIQEALLIQVLLKELYGAKAQFVPVPSGTGVIDVDGYLLPPNAPMPDSGITLDLGREWFELTTRPMVWALLAATAGGVESAEAKFLRDGAGELQGEPEVPSAEEPTSVTLAAYAHAGLEAWVHHVFYHQALDDLPLIPFVVIVGDESEEEPDSGDQGSTDDDFT